MKRFIFLILCMGLLNINAKAQDFEYYEMPVSLTRNSNWYNEGYPYITSIYGKFFDIIDYHYENPDHGELSEAYFDLYDIVTSINGIDIKEYQLNEIRELCYSSDTITYTKISPGFEEPKPIVIKVKQKNNKYTWPKSKDGYFNDETANELTPYPYYNSTGLKVMADKNVDFSKVRTYDILITGNDPLTDQAILNAFCNNKFFRYMTRDEKNPDIIITIAKSSEESISSVYVPQTTQLVGTKTEFNPVYNYITRTVSYVANQKHRYQKSGGYTQTTNNQSLYLEISILDAKKINDPSQTHAPIIWQMVYNANFVNRDINIDNQYIVVASWNPYPFKDALYNHYVDLTIGVRLNYNSIIEYIKPGSAADKLGLKIGDRIIKVNGKNKINFSWGGYNWYLGNLVKNEYSLKENNSMKRYLSDIYNITRQTVRGGGFSYSNTELADRSCTFTVLRDGKKIELTGVLIPFDPTGATKVEQIIIQAALY